MPIEIIPMLSGARYAGIKAEILVGVGIDTSAVGLVRAGCVAVADTF